MAKDIALTACNSSNVCGHGYDAETKTMAVQFRHGATYQFADVPPEVYADFTKAESFGRFFAQRVKDKFKHEKLPPPEKAAAQAQ